MVGLRAHRCAGARIDRFGSRCNWRHESGAAVGSCTSDTLQVRESPEMYWTITLPHIESIPAAHIKWVHNILERKVRCPHTYFWLIC